MSKLGNRNLYPVGFMGSGKDKVGKIIAERMGRRMVNTDALIVEREGMTINEIFDKHGQPYFRRIETKVLLEVSRQENLVVSTGGGAFCQPSRRNRVIMNESGIVVWLDVELPILRERLKNKTDRPLARDPAKMEELFWQCREFYGQAPFRVRVNIEVPAEEVAERVLQAISWP